ncbi:SDR family NAD(P)-dependent oxidoreductase [Pseudomonas sp. P7548]|uniref:SDR family NAD(P)-dependent oxidoreductase n=1 Tax=Pseudomonas sp. P7548 TaxID=2726981 RepID=UPI0015BB3481|nr:SDR family oxidoreductase [Pseudomonas sp. P7548]NWE23866.1 SDR family oxidoreductase [Pseudomonas sp. P7548]
MAETVLKLSGKVVLITGGSSGIGLAAAQLMHKHGAEVVIVGRDAKKLHEAVTLIGPYASGVAADVSKLEDIDRVMRVVAVRHGRIDVLVVNAGTSHSPPLREVDEAAFDAMIGLNFKAAFFTVQRALPLLGVGASVILTGSAAADLGRWGDPLYAASKAAVRSLARTFANDEALAHRQVRFNVLSPGAVKTPLTQEAYEQPDVDAYVCAAVPLKRWGAAEEIARAALFLACSDSSYMTGSVLAIDGGMAQV